MSQLYSSTVIGTIIDLQSFLEQHELKMKASYKKKKWRVEVWKKDRVGAGESPNLLDAFHLAANSWTFNWG